MLPRKGLPPERLDVLPQFTVSANSTVVMSAQAASSEIKMVTTRPTALGDLTVEFRRGTADGHTFSASWEANFPIYVSPTTQRPTVGKLAVVTSAQLGSPKGHGHSLPVQPGLRRHERAHPVRSARGEPRPAWPR